MASPLCIRLRLDSIPIADSDNPRAFYWNLETEAPECHELYLRQLRVFFQVVEPDADHSGTGPMVDAVIATGEPFSIIPRTVWSYYGFEPRIRWFHPRTVYTPTNPPPFRHGRSARGSPAEWCFRDPYPFEFGLIWATPYSDDSRPPLPARPMIARFLQSSPPDIRDALVGLHWSLLTNRRLVRRSDGSEIGPPPTLEEWWLCEPAQHAGE
jgi:hypothetical protein